MTLFTRHRWGCNLAPDEAYITLAIPEQRVIVTLDADFHAILATQGLTQPSVIRLRMHNPDPQEVALAIDEICKEHAGQLRDGCAISSKGKSHRLRRLPIQTKDATSSEFE
jgi:predicted nuclease of predicted toxin-antitoxin system